MRKLLAFLSLLLAFSMVACSSSLPVVTEEIISETKAETKTEAVTEEKTETDEIALDGVHDPTGFATGFGKVVCKQIAVGNNGQGQGLFFGCDPGILGAGGAILGIGKNGQISVGF